MVLRHALRAPAACTVRRPEEERTAAEGLLTVRAERNQIRAGQRAAGWVIGGGHLGANGGGPLVATVLGSRWRTARLLWGTGSTIQWNQHFRNAKGGRYSGADESHGVTDHRSQEAGVAIHDRHRPLLIASFRADCDVHPHRHGPGWSCCRRRRAIWGRHTPRRHIRFGRLRHGNRDLHAPSYRLYRSRRLRGCTERACLWRCRVLLKAQTEIGSTDCKQQSAQTKQKADTAHGKMSPFRGTRGAKYRERHGDPTHSSRDGLFLCSTGLLVVLDGKSEDGDNGG